MINSIRFVSQLVTEPGYVENMTPQQRADAFILFFKTFGDFAGVLKLGDIFSYARSREALMALTLGHTLAPKLAGPDATRPDGIEAEYKTTIQKRIAALYSGLSNKATWAEQLAYLKNEKIGCYPFHYIARFEGSEIAEIWELSADCVLEVLTKKLHKTYHDPKHRADPRLSATLCMTEIKQHGIQVYPLRRQNR